MSHYVLSPRAQRDIEEIWDYGNEHWGLEVADRYARLLQKAIETLARSPDRGRPCPEVRGGYSKFAVGSHMIFYIEVKGGIDVKRILHQSRGFERHS